MISEIIPINHQDRVANVNNLYRHIKKHEGDNVEVVVACDNPVIFDQLEYDVLVGINKRIEFTRSVNLAVQYAKHELVGFIDDSVSLPEGWSKRANKLFYERFKDGQGAMVFEGWPGVDICWSRGLTTKTYAFSKNRGNLLWPEYIHGGDHEFAQGAKLDGAYYVCEEIEFRESKIDDISWEKNRKVFRFDGMVETYRHSNRKRLNPDAIYCGYPNFYWWDWHNRFKDYCKDDNDLQELYSNFYSIITCEVRYA